MAGNERLSQRARRAIEDDVNEVLVSAASAWEITTKHRLGRLPSASALALDIPGAVVGQNFEGLPITLDDAAQAGALPGPHGDPFDRMLVAQAIARNLVIISNESLFDLYGVSRLW